MTRHKIGPDNPQISKIKDTNGYPNPLKEKQTYQEATHIFHDIARQEGIVHSRPNTIHQLIQLAQTDKSIAQFIYLLHEIKSANL